MTVSIVQALCLLTPWDVNLSKVRVGPAHDGGYVFLAELLQEPADVFSYGIDGEHKLDIELASCGHKIFMFDHTIEGILNTTHDPKLIFVKESVGGRKSLVLPVDTLQGHLQKYAPQSTTLILKMDVEGCEYEAFDATPRETLRRFQQIVFEVHNLHLLGDETFRATFYRVMTKLTRDFTIFHVHANNYDGDFYGNVAGIPVVNLLEVSMVRTDLVSRRPSQTLYPTALDEPCVKPDDKKLWFFPFLPTSTKVEDFVAAEKRLRLTAELKVLRS